MNATNTAIDPPTPPAGGYPMPPQPGDTRRRGAGAIVVGAVLLGLGFLTAASGGALLALFGAGAAIGSGEHPVSTGTSAIVADLGQIHDMNDFRAITGSPTLSVSAANGGDHGAFVGIGRTDDVERYLAGVSVERVSDLELNPFRLDSTGIQGDGSVTAPAAQSFWVASSGSSNRAELSWRLTDGSYEVVVMNADGTPGVVTSAQIAVALPNSTGLWFTVLAIGAAAMIIGGALIVVGVSGNKRP